MKSAKNNQTVISTYGISGEISPDKQFSTTYPYWDESFQSYPHFCKKYGMSPISLIVRDEKYGRDLVLIASTYSARNVISSTFDKEIELNTNLASVLSHWNASATNKVIFYLNALRHNLVSIIKAYNETALGFSRVLAIPNSVKGQLPEKDSLLPNSNLPINWIRKLPIERVGASMVGSGFCEDVFYDMVGYIASARILLDSLVGVLRNRSSIVLTNTINRKSSYHKLNNDIQNCKMPDDLRNFIVKNREWTSTLINYRNCMTHYEILSRTARPSVMIIHSENRVIAQFIWLPDNPEAFSKKKFSFDKHIDYLGYAHSTYLKIVDLCSYILRDTHSELENK